MEDSCGNRPLLGEILLGDGEVTGDEIEDALAAQTESGEQIGEILVDAGAICRPVLARAVARQNGVALKFERGYGSGLSAAIERRHRLKRDSAADAA